MDKDKAMLKLIQYIEKKDGSDFTEEEMDAFLDMYLDFIDNHGFTTNGNISYWSDDV